MSRTTSIRIQILLVVLVLWAAMVACGPVTNLDTATSANKGVQQQAPSAESIGCKLAPEACDAWTTAENVWGEVSK